jgi:hypothetical protein
MSVSEQEMTYLASQVVEDAVRGGLDKWKALLAKVEDIEGLDQGRSSVILSAALIVTDSIKSPHSGVAFGSSLSTVTVPQTFYPQSTSVLSLIRQSYPTLAPSASDSLPSPPESPSHSAADEWDVIRKSKLPHSRSTTQQQLPTQVIMKQCMRCGKESGAVSATVTGGVWATFEESWRNRCACGGFWRTI